jgi:hypothetical protein
MAEKLMDEITDWFALRMKNGLMKEDVVCMQILWQPII